MQLSDLKLSGTYTYADYLKWTFEERLELIRGKIFKMSPAPNRLHQQVVHKINGELYKQLKGKHCQVYPAPFDVRLPLKQKDSTRALANKDEQILTVLQPDICIICDLNKLDDKGCIGAPEIVIEILSPGNNKKELKYKYEVYEEAGVQEYWVIHPQEKTFLKYTLSAQGQYVPSKLFITGDVVSTPILPGFILNLEDVFDEEP